MSRSVSVAASVATSAAPSERPDAEDKTVVLEPDIKEEDEDSDGTVIQNTQRDDENSLVSELLSDEEAA